MPADRPPRTPVPNDPATRAWAKAVTADAPPLTPDQIARLRVLVNPRPRWTYAAENLPAAREAGYDV